MSARLKKSGALDPPPAMQEAPRRHSHPSTSQETLDGYRFAAAVSSSGTHPLIRSRCLATVALAAGGNDRCHSASEKLGRDFEKLGRIGSCPLLVSNAEI